METSWFKIIVDKIKLHLLNFSFTRNNSPSIKVVEKSKTIDKSQHVHHHGLTVNEAKELVEVLVDKKMMEFKVDAENTFDKRVTQFKTKVFEGLQNLSESELDKLREPDAQFALRQAAFISGKKTNKELIDTLGSLVIGRIKNHQIETEDLKNIVFNEAIQTIDKLTPNQLKIITLCYILSQTYMQGIKTIKEFNEYLNRSVKPFLDFKNTNAEFQHIQYAGCGSIGIGQWNITVSFRESYSLVFQKTLTPNEVEKIDLDPEIKSKIFVKQSQADEYTIPVTEKKILETYLKDRNLDSEKIKEIVNILDQHLMGESEIREKIEKDTDIGKDLMKKLDDTPIKNLQLTSVGIAIAATYYENIVGEKLNIDLWIN